MRLFHFSDDRAIESFVPRPVRVADPRREGEEWLNGPLVWAIDAVHQPMYLFPRDCPRILLWRKAGTTKDDVDRYFGSSHARMLAYVEKRWVARIEAARLFRYELPTSSFQSLNDAGMWVSHNAVRPIERVRLDKLPTRLRNENVDLRVVDSLTPLRGVWNSSLHASGIRLRNARGWS